MVHGIELPEPSLSPGERAVLYARLLEGLSGVTGCSISVAPAYLTGLAEQVPFGLLHSSQVEDLLTDAAFTIARDGCSPDWLLRIGGMAVFVVAYENDAGEPYLSIILHEAQRTSLRFARSMGFTVRKVSGNILPPERVLLPKVRTYLIGRHILEELPSCWVFQLMPHLAPAIPGGLEAQLDWLIRLLESRVPGGFMVRVDFARSFEDMLMNAASGGDALRTDDSTSYGVLHVSTDSDVLRGELPMTELFADHPWSHQGRVRGSVTIAGRQYTVIDAVASRSGDRPRRIESIALCFTGGASADPD